MSMWMTTRQKYLRGMLTLGDNHLSSDYSQHTDIPGLWFQRVEQASIGHHLCTISLSLQAASVILGPSYPMLY